MTAPRIRLHHVPQSRSMRTLWLLHELGLDFEVVTHPFDKSLRRPEYLALSPAGRVPSLEYDGQVLFETGAIAEFLCERHAPDTLGRPLDHPERGAWLSWLHHAETITQHAATLTQQHLVLRDDAMRSPVLMQLEAARLGKCFKGLEGHLTRTGQDHMLAEGFSAADIGLGQAVYLGRYFQRLDPHPALAGWYARITARPAFEASLPAAGEALYDRDFYAAWETA